MIFYVSGWSYDKTDEARSFVPECDIFNIGFIIFECRTHYRASLYNIARMTVLHLFCRMTYHKLTILFFS